MSLLNEVLADIGNGLCSSPPSAPSATERGEYGDFELSSHGPVSLFTPLSDAAIRWVIENVPEWVDRHGTRGFTLDADEMDHVEAAAIRDGLVDCNDYRELEKQKQEWWHQQEQDGWAE